MAESDRRRAVGTRKSPNVAMLTLHNVRNYGSVLQAFATQRLIENAGAQCTVIDFRRQGIGDQPFAKPIFSHSAGSADIRRGAGA